ncbi:uncharacterized protein A4U43_C03F18570 [Asparagus officinalis]|uniref:Uncharacterized protein n=1 Tax=Asparagus officinalis TaxID=4686 RepID=A0A5P1FE06_ASPOF|nr:uncharacterized protein A4U43_C03F18570 [Asparagus officinalis]
MAVVRREEVRRLAWLAAKEAARAEADTLAYMVPPFAPSPAVDDDGADAGREIRVGDWAMPPPPAQVLLPQCVVCYRHATTRCSRCKGN